MFRKLLSTLLLMFSFSAVQAEEIFTHGDLTFSNGWARASIGTERPTAAYVSITNNGDQTEKLVGAQSDAGMMTEIHTIIKDGDLAKMVPAGDVSIEPGETVVLKPGGLHIMLMKLRRPIEQGQDVQIVLRFEHAGEVEISLPVGAPGALAP